MRQARAARYYGVGDLRLESVEIPPPGPGEVTLEVAYSGICGTDLHEYFSQQAATPVTPHPITGAQLPVILGHEFSGTVVECGKGVSRLKPGDRVAVQPTYSCGTCLSCASGHTNTCLTIALHGISAQGGGLSEFTNIREGMAFVLPDEVSLLQGALVEPMAVSRHGVARALNGRSPEGVAFVGGAGLIGLGAIVALRDAGVEEIIASDLSPVRRDSALAVGATEVFDPTQASLADVLDGRRLGIAVEAAGSGEVIDAAIRSLGARGRLSLIGMHEHPMQLDPTLMLLREVEVVGSSIYMDEDFDDVIAAMASGSYDALDCVETRPLDELIPAFEELRAGTATKIAIAVTGG